MLVHLRGQFDKVAWHARNAAIVHILEESVQGMAKLMEHGGCLVGIKQGRLSGSWLGEVAHDGNDGDDFLAVFIALFTVRGAPGTAALGGTWEEVHKQDGKLASVGIMPVPVESFMMCFAVEITSAMTALMPSGNSL